MRRTRQLGRTMAVFVLNQQKKKTDKESDMHPKLLQLSSIVSSFGNNCLVLLENRLLPSALQ